MFSIRQAEPYLPCGRFSVIMYINIAPRMIKDHVKYNNDQNEIRYSVEA